MGRKKSFDPEQALMQAMLLFWERGYEATSMADLSNAMGLKPPSIYAAFGNKETLFERCAEFYVQNIASYATRALDEEVTILKALRRYVFEAIEAFSVEGNPRGCLLVSAATNCSENSTGAQDLLVSYRAGSEAAIADRIRRGIAQGDVPAISDPDLLAKYISVLILGLAAQARDGATPDALLSVAELALSQIGCPSPN